MNTQLETTDTSPDLYTIDYDSVCECYVWWYDNTGMCLGADSMDEAIIEVQGLVDQGIYPEHSIFDESEG